MTREELSFASGGGRCAAWLLRPETRPDGRVPVVVMAHGFSLTRHDGLLPFAERLARAGLAVLVFDFRGLGDSAGDRPGRFRTGEQREDWRNAIAFARALPGVDAGRVVGWSYSMGAATLVQAAREEPGGIAALAVLCPFLDGRWRALRTPPALSAWITPRALLDAAGVHTTIPVTGQPGERAAMTNPGEADGFALAVGEGSPWRNAISPAVFLTVATLRPVTLAEDLPMPVWCGLAERDRSVSLQAVERFASRAPRGELQRYPYDHFEPFGTEAAARIAEDQVAFLRRAGVLSR